MHSPPPLCTLSLVLSVSRALLSLSLFSVPRRIGYLATSLMDPRALIIVMALACSDPRVVPTIRDCLPSSCLRSRSSFSSSFLLETARKCGTAQISFPLSSSFFRLPRLHGIQLGFRPITLRHLLLVFLRNQSLTLVEFARCRCGVSSGSRI